MLLLDEYDVPLQSAYVEGFYDEAVKFFRDFYGNTFKDNQYLEKTVITGVSRVAKESIFSGANNFKVFTILDNDFSEDCHAWLYRADYSDENHDKRAYIRIIRMKILWRG